MVGVTSRGIILEHFSLPSFCVVGFDLWWLTITRSKCWPTFAQHRNPYWTDSCAWKYLDVPGLHVIAYFFLMSSMILWRFMVQKCSKWIANDIWLPRVIFLKGTTCWCLFGYSTIPSMLGFCILEMESQAEGLGCLNVLVTPHLSL